VPKELYNLNEISAMAGITPRTDHFHVQQGLVPHPGTRGPGAKYERRHLTRLRPVRMLQAEHLPLAEIRERLAAMSDAQVEQAVLHGEASRGVTRRAPATE
jgi:DNA-binding transcriptional MerR regulator